MLELPYDVTEIDPVYGHVDHTRSLKILEWGRLELVRMLGFSTEQFIAEDLFYVVTALKAVYKREVLRERVTVTCDDWKLADKRFTMHQRILNKRGKIAIEAEVEWLFMSGTQKRVVEPHGGFLRALRKFWPESA